MEVMGEGGLYPQSCTKKCKGLKRTIVNPSFKCFFENIVALHLSFIMSLQILLTHAENPSHRPPVCHTGFLCLLSAAAFSCHEQNLSLSLMVLYWMFAGLKAEDSERFKTMVQFECRGLEPIDFQPQVSIYENRVLQCVLHRPRCANNCCIPCRFSAMVLTMLIHWYGLLAYRLVNWMKCY